MRHLVLCLCFLENSNNYFHLDANAFIAMTKTSSQQFHGLYDNHHHCPQGNQHNHNHRHSHHQTFDSEQVQEQWPAGNVNMVMASLKAPPIILITGLEMSIDLVECLEHDWINVKCSRQCFFLTKYVFKIFRRNHSMNHTGLAYA